MLNLSNIQHFSVGDGEGIRTTVFLKGCNLRCPWCHNPENLTAKPVVLRYKATGKTETLGRLASSEEVIAELLEDRDFYEASGGGVTFSGGEALLQAEALAEVCAALKEAGISVLVDTAGCVPYDAFRRLNPLISGYLFDFKTADGDKYRSIGGDLSLVKENLSRLKADGISVRIRIPLIPGFNTDGDSLTAICEQLRGLGFGEVDLIPFHRLGSGKYEAMGLDYAYGNQPPLSGEETERIRAIFETYFTVKTEE
jgi:pyruvate formate lyase activating enzyme